VQREDALPGEPGAHVPPELQRVERGEDDEARVGGTIRVLDERLAHGELRVRPHHLPDLSVDHEVVATGPGAVDLHGYHAVRPGRHLAHEGRQVRRAHHERGRRGAAHGGRCRRSGGRHAEGFVT
jgi:hypothetical protein